jgi:flagellar assembly protein FliH
VQVFEYPPVAGPPLPSWEAFPSIAIHDSAAHRLQKSGYEAPETQPAIHERHVEELRRSFESGRARGLEEGRAAERQCSAALEKDQETGRIEETARLVENFNAQRARYFESAEREVVKLALALAARILRREAQMDPLLLSGAVRVALGQLSASTTVRLRVPAEDLELWRDTITHLPNLAVKPEVVAGDAMTLGECMLESDLGSVHLGIASQLAEIDHALFEGTGTARETAKASIGAMTVAEDMAE